MSTLEVGMDNLSAVDYSDKIRGIIQTLRQSAKEPSVGSTSISFDIDKIAHNVATTYASDTRYPFENKQGTTYASTYFPDIAKKIAFSNQIKDLEKEVAQLLFPNRSEEHTSELQSPDHLVCRLLLEKKKLLKPECKLIGLNAITQSFWSLPDRP